MKKIVTSIIALAVCLQSTAFSQTPEWSRVLQVNNYGNPLVSGC